MDSRVELRADERNGRTVVEMFIRREFQPGVKGRIASLVNHLIGEIYFDRYLRSVLRTVEEEESTPAR